MRLKISLFWRNSSSFNLQGFFNGVDERTWKKTITEDLKESIIMLPVALYSEEEQEADFQRPVQNRLPLVPGPVPFAAGMFYNYHKCF